MAAPIKQPTTLYKLEQTLSAELEAARPEALKRACPLKRVTNYDLAGTPITIQSFHAKIGHWNTTLVDSIRLQFPDPKDFLSRWLAGLLDRVNSIETQQRAQYNGQIFQNSSEHELVRFLKDPVLRKYIFTFLERNFYRNFQARTRAKPQESLWQIWFGRGSMTWGLLLAPAFRNGKWTNDVSEIRRAGYHYWTIGHVLRTGIVDPASSEPMRWTDTDQFLVFYRSVLKRESNSVYEQAIADRYVAYLKRSKDPESEPLLIPELRYGGCDVKHVHRLDYTVLNSHNMELTGFELSPASTHISISGMQKDKKSQLQINQELSGKWEKEMKKRNEYFDTFSIPIVTFTDGMLQDIDACFNRIAEKLAARDTKVASFDDSLRRLDDYRIGNA